MPIKLVVHVPRGSTTEVSDHVFTRSRILIGRSPDSDLVLPGDEVRVSRHHVRIERRPEGYVLVDLGSRNGTLLNGAVVPPTSVQPLKQGDVVRMGSIDVYMDAIDLSAPATSPEKKDPTRVVQRGEVQPQGAPAPAAAPAPAPAADPLAVTALAQWRALSEHFLGSGAFDAPAQVESFAQMVQMALDLLLEGLFKALAARKEFEGQFDAFVTMAFQRQANPIKQAQDLADFKRYAVDWRGNADPNHVTDSLQRAITDVSQHQVGLLAGMQQVLEAIIKRLDPAQIERAAGGGFGAEKKAWRT
ncbi:MAG: FHA domain-containing protein [Planctomycetes bacterium]|nr:FHA domain-containing protein [Planctomycetota bacterium]